MSSTASATSQGSSLTGQFQASASSSASSVPGRDLFTPGLIHSKVAYVMSNHLSAETICSLTRVNIASFNFCKTHELKLKELYYKDQLLNNLLPGIKEEQLPCTLASYHRKTKEIMWEKTYRAISNVVFSTAFFESIGVRAESIGEVAQSLLEKKYLPTHTIEIPANSTLGLSRNGRLTNGPQNPADLNDPGHYAPIGHRHHRPQPAAVAEGLRTLEFPNTPCNRDLLVDPEFLETNPGLIIPPYLKLSPLEQGSPLLAFQTNLEIDVPEGSPLRVTPQGVLTEEPGPNEPAVNGIRTIQFLNTPHNWLTLAAPILTHPSREAGPDNPYIAKYLSRNAKPVGISYVFDPIKTIWDTPVLSEWKAPTTKLLALGDTYLHAEAEALALEQRPQTFQQDSIHRIFTQMRGNLDSYPTQFSRTDTDITAFWGTVYKAGTYVYPAAVAPVEPARVDLYFRLDDGDVGLAAAWGPAGSS